MDDRWDLCAFSARAKTLTNHVVVVIAISCAVEATLARVGSVELHAIELVTTWAALIAGAVVFIRWLRFYFDNALAWTEVALPFSASDAAWSFFIPFVNLIRPWQVLDALWKASDPASLPAPVAAISARTDVNYRTGPALDAQLEFPTQSPVLAWATLYIWLPVAVSLIAVFATVAYGPMFVQRLPSVAQHVLRAFAGCVAIVMVRGVQQRVAERVRRIEATRG